MIAKAIVILVTFAGAMALPAPADARERPRTPQPSPAMLAKLLLAPELRGQWGLTPADCDGTPADNPGVMLVEAASLRFLDAVASPTVIDRLGPRQWRSTFNHVEGQERGWEVKTLTLSEDGQRLTIATDTRSQTYRRCGIQR